MVEASASYTMEGPIFSSEALPVLKTAGIQAYLVALANLHKEVRAAIRLTRANVSEKRVTNLTHTWLSHLGESP